jgi:excisionase family DNA binding protein
MENTSNLLSEKQAAKFLGVSSITLFRKRKNREINFYRVGFRILYSREKHLLPFLDSCEQKAREASLNA